MGRTGKETAGVTYWGLESKCSPQSFSLILNLQQEGLLTESLRTTPTRAAPVTLGTGREADGVGGGAGGLK